MSRCTPWCSGSKFGYFVYKAEADFDFACANKIDFSSKKWVNGNFGPQTMIDPKPRDFYKPSKRIEILD